MPATNAIPVEFFPAIDGSMSSSDGQTFYLKAERDDGNPVMLGFPHTEIPNIIELAAMQLAHGRDAEGQSVVTAFQSTSFTVGRGPNGEVVLSLTVGQTGRISFLLPDGMPEQIIEVLAKSVTRH